MRKLLLLFLLLIPHQASADVALLVHGYLGGASSWEKSGINKILSLYGWKHQGTLISALPGLVIGPNNTNTVLPKHSVYSVDLPFKAPLDIQADMLQEILNSLAYYHIDEPITIVGHSAGGLVARVALVKYGKGNVKRLITIASPHLGTPRAAQALKAAKSSGPFGFVKSFFGGADYRLVKSSKRLLIELLPARPYNYLFGLNQAPHPDIEYISIVRTTPVGRVGDQLVPGYSQDMNNVPALAGRSYVYLSTSIHQLVPKDGILLSIILNDDTHEEPKIETNTTTNVKTKNATKAKN